MPENRGLIVLPQGDTALVEIDIVNGSVQSGDAQWISTGDIQLNVYDTPGNRTASVLRTGAGNGQVTVTVPVTYNGEAMVNEHVFDVRTSVDDDGSPHSRANVQHNTPAS